VWWSSKLDSGSNGSFTGTGEPSEQGRESDCSLCAQYASVGVPATPGSTTGHSSPQGPRPLNPAPKSPSDDVAAQPLDTEGRSHVILRPKLT